MLTSNAPYVSPNPAAQDTTITNMLLFLILQALDAQVASAIPDDVISTLVGNENFQ